MASSARQALHTRLPLPADSVTSLQVAAFSERRIVTLDAQLKALGDKATSQRVSQPVEMAAEVDEGLAQKRRDVEKDRELEVISNSSMLMGIATTFRTFYHNP